MFCPIHRYADQHGCTFDYRKLKLFRPQNSILNPILPYFLPFFYAKAGKDQLRKDNPVVQDDKIVKF